MGKRKFTQLHGNPGLRGIPREIREEAAKGENADKRATVFCAYWHVRENVVIAASRWERTEKGKECPREKDGNSSRCK